MKSDFLKGGALVYNLPSASVKPLRLADYFDWEKTRELWEQLIDSDDATVRTTYLKRNGEKIIAPINVQQFTFITRDDRSVIYQLTRVISSGSYASVYLLSRLGIADGTPSSLVMKIPFTVNGLEQDLEVLRALGDTRDDQDHLILDGQILPILADLTTIFGSYESLDVIVMERMDGNLKTLTLPVTKLSLWDIEAVYLNILLQTLEGVNFLLEKGYAYTDMKAENLLFRVLNPGQLEVFIGDHGSAAHMSKSLAIATYPYLFRETAYHFLPHHADLIWGLLILYFQLHSQFISQTTLNQLGHAYIQWSIDKKRSVLWSLVGQMNTNIHQIYGPESSVLKEFNIEFITFCMKDNLLLEDGVGIWNKFQRFIAKTYLVLLNRSQWAKEHLVLPQASQRRLDLLDHDSELEPEPSVEPSVEPSTEPVSSAEPSAEPVSSAEPSVELENDWITWLYT